MKLCSACLLGIKCSYDGKSNRNKKVIELAKKRNLDSYLSRTVRWFTNTKRESRTARKKVLTKSGKDVTKNFKIGAKQALEIAKLFGIKEAILKQRSPSCGCGQIYDGTFSGRIIKGDGVTTAFLKKNEIKIKSEENLG